MKQFIRIKAKKIISLLVQNQFHTSKISIQKYLTKKNKLNYLQLTPIVCIFSIIHASFNCKFI